MTETEKEAEQLSPCTCEIKLITGHFANCPSENQEDIADALSAAYARGVAAERARIRKICEKQVEDVQADPPPHVVRAILENPVVTVRAMAVTIAQEIIREVDAGEPKPKEGDFIEALQNRVHLERDPKEATFYPRQCGKANAKGEG